MEVLLLIVRIFLFGVFAVSGLGKLLDLEGSRKAVREFGVPQDVAPAAGLLLPLVEIAIAVSLLFVSSFWYGTAAGAILLAVFTAGMLRQIRAGKAPDCHCFGQISSAPVGYASVLRNLAFFAAAAFLLVVGEHDRGIGLGADFESTIQGAALLGLIVLGIVAIAYLKKIFDGQAQVMRRLEVLEVISADGVQKDRTEAGSPTDTLPIGALFPEFNLPVVENGYQSLTDLLKEGKPVLAFFVSATCEPCAALLPKIEAWRHDLRDSVKLILVSSGTREENEEKFATRFFGDILIDEDRQLAEAVYAKWTPTALLIGSSGRIASRAAAGDTAIADLVGLIRKADLSSKDLFVRNGKGTGKEPMIGETVPSFSLESVNGFPVTDDYLRGRQTLVVFWSKSCPHCVAMIDEIKSWDLSRSRDDASMLIVTEGEREEYVRLGLESPIVLDPGYEIAGSMGMFGTPSAVLIDEDGRVISETAIGAPNIWALVRRRRLSETTNA